VGGQGAPPSSISHTYDQAGSYTATLTVVDGSGNVGTTDQAVTLTGAAFARDTWITATPIVGYAPQPVIIDGSQSSPGSWTIAFGDGSAAEHGTGVPPSNLIHTYSTPASYTQTLTIVANGKTTVARSRITVLAASLPGARTAAATGVKAKSAVLNGHVLPNAADTTAWFEWGTSPGQLTHRTSTQQIPRGMDVHAPLTRLARGTTYYFQMVATNSIGTTIGHVVTFTTKP
jgi:PKD repeat protein